VTSLFVAQAAKNAGVQKGKSIGYKEGYHDRDNQLAPFVKKALRLEKRFAEGGLEALWRGKVIYSTNPHIHDKSNIKDRREVFLHALAYAEYHQRHVEDPVDHMMRMSNRFQEEIDNAKKNGGVIPPSQLDALSNMNAATQKNARGMKKGQAKEGMEQWIKWRVGVLTKAVKYATKLAIIPTKASLGNSVTTKPAGDAIANDDFDIVSDAQNYLGEQRTEFGY